MAMYKTFLRVGQLFLAALLLCPAFFFVSVPAARATSGTNGYAVTIAAANGTSFPFAVANKVVNGTVVIPTADIGAEQTASGFFFEISGQPTTHGSLNSITNGPTSSSYYFSYELPLDAPIGSYTIRTGFTSRVDSTTIYSNPVTITVTKITLRSDAGMINGQDDPYWQAGTNRTVNMLPLTQNQLNLSDWKNGTFNLTFTGPQNMTENNLHASDNYGSVTIALPSQKGAYHYTFTYSGTGEINPITYTGTIKISAWNTISSIKLYSNPPTTTPGQNILYYIVFSGIAGYPPPTGQIRLACGIDETSIITLNSDGTVLVSVKWPDAGSTIGVAYTVGDYNYAPGAHSVFPATNPSIPTNTGAGGNPNTPASAPTPSNTPTPALTATATPIDGITPTPASDPQLTTHSPGTLAKSGNADLWIWLVVVLLVVCSGAAGVSIMPRRRARSTPAFADTVLTFANTAVPGTLLDMGTKAVGEEDAENPLAAETTENNPVEEASGDAPPKNTTGEEPSLPEAEDI